MSGLKSVSTSANTEVANHVARSVGPVVQARINALQVGQKMQDLPEELWHDSFRFYVKQDPNRKGGPNLRMIRLDPNKPSLTVTGYVFNKFVHPFEDRFITVREAARLQGFPDSLEFKGTLTSTQQQVGNAVPIPLARAVFESVLKFAKRKGMGSNLSALSLFSGAGGMDIGASLAQCCDMSINTMAALEVWEDACNTLQGFYGDSVQIVQRDITAIDRPLALWKSVTGSDDMPCIVFGGPPCQSFSQAGKQKGLRDGRGKLIFEFLRFVETLKPTFFVMENVSNLKGIEQGSIYRRVIKVAKELGYQVNVKKLLAADHGAPQLRWRLIFIGCRNDIGGCPSMPVPTHTATANLFGLGKYMTVGEAFAGLPKAMYSDGRRC